MWRVSSTADVLSCVEFLHCKHADVYTQLQVMQHCGETCLEELVVITIKLHNGWNRLELMSHWQPEQLVKFPVRSKVVAASTAVDPAYVVYWLTLSLSLQVCGLRVLTAMIWMYVLLKRVPLLQSSAPYPSNFLEIRSLPPQARRKLPLDLCFDWDALKLMINSDLHLSYCCLISRLCPAHTFIALQHRCSLV